MSNFFILIYIIYRYIFNNYILIRMGEEDYFGIVTVTVMVILLLYATFGALFEAKHVDILNVKIFYIKRIVSSDP